MPQSEFAPPPIVLTTSARLLRAVKFFRNIDRRPGFGYLAQLGCFWTALATDYTNRSSPQLFRGDNGRRYGEPLP